MKTYRVEVQATAKSDPRIIASELEEMTMAKRPERTWYWDSDCLHIETPRQEICINRAKYALIRVIAEEKA